MANNENDKKAVRSADTLMKLLSEAITNYDFVEIALLTLMGKYNFDVNTLQLALAGPPIVS